MENTGTVEFIGPGSEWFWIALQFFALSGTFYAIYRQLKAQQREIRASTKAQLSLGYHNAIRLGQRPLEMLIEDATLARIVTRGYEKREALDDVAWARFENYMFLQFNAWEFFYYQHRDSQIPKELWVGADDYYRRLINTKPGLSYFWSAWQSSYDEPFRSHVTQQFAMKPAPIVPQG